MRDRDASIVALPSNHMAADLGDEHVILNLTDEVYYGVEGTAARIWELVQEPRTFDFLVQTICAEFDVDEERCASDVASFIDELEKRQFVRVTPSAS